MTALVLAELDRSYLEAYDDEAYYKEVEEDIRKLNVSRGFLARSIDKAKAFLQKYGHSILQHTAAVAMLTAVIVAVTKLMDNAKVALKLTDTTHKLAEILQLTSVAVGLYQVVNVVVKSMTPSRYGSIGDRVEGLVDAHDKLKDSLRDFKSAYVSAEKAKANKAGVIYTRDPEENVYSKKRADLIKNLSALDVDSPEYQKGIDTLAKLQREDEQRVFEKINRAKEEAKHQERTSEIERDVEDKAHGMRRSTDRRVGAWNGRDDEESPSQARVREYKEYKQRMYEQQQRHRGYEEEYGAYGSTSALSLLSSVSTVAIPGHALAKSHLYSAVTATTEPPAPQRYQEDMQFLKHLDSLSPEARDALAQRLAGNPTQAYTFVEHVRNVLQLMREDTVGNKVYRLGGLVVQWSAIFAANAVIFKLLQYVTKNERFGVVGAFTRTALAIICVLNSILVMLATTGTGRLPSDTGAINKVKQMATRTKELMHKSMFKTTPPTEAKR